MRKLLILITVMFACYSLSGKEVLAEEKVSATISSQRDEVLKGAWTLIDSPYWTFNSAGKDPIGYVTSKNSIRQTAQVIDSKIVNYLKNSAKFSSPISPSEFDSRGRWLQGIYDDGTGLLRGFYHAEGGAINPCDNVSGVKSVAYAESSDGGITWKTPNYPNNQIVTGMYEQGAGDFLLREFDGFLYIYYYEHACGTASTAQGTAVARAPISSKGKPGAWTKYYCDASGCGFGKQPGLGGKFTRLSYNGQRNVNMCNLQVSWNTYLEKYISTACIDNRRIIVVTSTDLVNWTAILPVLEVPEMQSTGTLLAYKNILSLSGDTQITDKTFWQYYVGVTRNGSSSNHMLYRQKVTLKKTGTNIPLPTLKKGDANRDGSVNVADYNVWKANYGKTAPAWPEGANLANFNDAGVVDGLDYAIWFNKYQK